MINTDYKTLKASGQSHLFTVCTIKLMDAVGYDCGVIKFVRMGQIQDDTLFYAMFEAIKTIYPLSTYKFDCYSSTQKGLKFYNYKRHKRLNLTCINFSLFDPAYMSGKKDSGFSMTIDVYKTNKHYTATSCSCYLRLSKQDITNAHKAAISNFATYREFLK